MPSIDKTLSPSAPLPQTIAQINDAFAKISNESQTKIIKDDTGTKRVVFGRFTDNQYGLKVSKEGKDVIDASSQDLIFDSNNSAFVILDSGELEIGEVSVSLNNETGEDSAAETYNHNLGFTPIVLAFTDSGSVPWSWMTADPFSTSPANWSNLQLLFGATSTSVTFTKWLIASSTTSITHTWVGPTTVKFYLLQETGV